MNTIKRFFKTKGTLRWKIAYALELVPKEDIMSRHFVTEKLEAGEWANVSLFSGDISKYRR